MSSSREDRYYGSQSKSRMSRSPPGGDSQNAGVFQTGQVPAPYQNQHPQQYSQLRPSPGRTDHNPALYGGQWTNNNPAARQAPPSFPYYEQPDPRYLSQNHIPSYPSRSSPLPQGDPYSSRRHNGPVGVSSSNDRWQPNPMYPTTGHVQVSGNIAPSSSAYPLTFDPYSPHQSTPYSYPPVADPRLMPQQAPLNPMHMVASSNMDRNMQHSRGDSPYARNPPSVSPPNYNQQPTSGSVSDEPAVKKKRKRADAGQLEVLNETYNRTAFPSTEERAELARKLEMTPRSVQIWFQNKRQSMRQTGRPSSIVISPTSHHHGFSLSPDAGYGDTTGMSSGDMSVLPSDSQHVQSHRRGRSHDDNDSHKWPRGY